MLNNETNNKKMNSEVSKVAKQALDIIILSKLLEEPTHGYGLIKYIYDKYGLFLTPSHIYPLLYELEEKGLINNKQDHKCKIYSVKERDKVKYIISEYLNTHFSFIKSLQREYSFVSNKLNEQPLSEVNDSK